MPELPEIENLVRELKENLEGITLWRVEICDESTLQTPRRELEKRLPGKKILRIGRIGKYIRIELSGCGTLWFHLGMTGQLFLSRSGETLLPHTHLILSLSDSNHLLYRDIRKFGRITLTFGKSGVPEGVQRLGPEPSQWDRESFAVLCKTRKARIKSLLLNQRFMAGLGNIYADESLHRAGIHPRRRSCDVPRRRLFRLHEAIGEVITEAIRWGGSSIDNYRHLDGARGRYQELHQVYGRGGKHCQTCGALIRAVKLAGRTSSYCPHCQPYKSGPQPVPQPIGA